MTSISSSGWGAGIQSLLQQQVAAGTIPSADRNALPAAIGDIRAATTPASMKSQVDATIDGDVSSGKLTSAQASELKGLFQKASGYMHAHHAHGGGGGSSALSDLLGTDDGTTTDALGVTTAAGSASTDPLTSVASGASGVVDGLASFVSSLRSAVSSNGLYGAAGGTAGRVGSLMVNAFA